MGYWRRVLAAVGAVLLLSFGSVQASETFDEELYQEQLEESGAQGLMDTLPPETQAFLSELGVEGAGWESLAAIDGRLDFDFVAGLDPESSIQRRQMRGSTHPDSVRQQISTARAVLAADADGGGHA